MEIAMTKISQNGQVVIPSEVRHNAGIKPFTKFLVFNKGGDIILKQIKKKNFDKIAQLITQLGRSEKQIKNGNYTKADSSMDDEEIDNLLMA